MVSAPAAGRATGPTLWPSSVLAPGAGPTAHQPQPRGTSQPAWRHPTRCDKKQKVPSLGAGRAAMWAPLGRGNRGQASSQLVLSQKGVRMRAATLESTPVLPGKRGDSGGGGPAAMVRCSRTKKWLHDGQGNEEALATPAIRNALHPQPRARETVCRVPWTFAQLPVRLGPQVTGLPLARGSPWAPASPSGQPGAWPSPPQAHLEALGSWRPPASLRLVPRLTLGKRPSLGQEGGAGHTCAR